MKKAAILTMVGYNFGNRLQNYALQQILSRMGYQAETLQRTKDSLITRGKRGLRALLIKDFFSKCIKFNRRINWSRYVVSTQYVSESLEDNYDFFVMGSDQIWNITFDFTTENDFLSMVRPAKKLSYAASFGTSQITEERKEWLAGLLNGIPHISVREEAGQQIVKELTGRDAVLVIDPTLMLTAEEWREMAVAPSDLGKEEHYILTYFLGPEPQKATEDKLKMIREHGWREYHLLDQMNPKSCKAGPLEFLYLIDHADLVLTDSFHACIFSFLFGKPFRVYPREGKETNMLSRIYTLLKMFFLERKFSESGWQDDLLEHDYSAGYEVLDGEREKARKYLESAMEVKNK